MAAGVLVLPDLGTQYSPLWRYPEGQLSPTRATGWPSLALTSGIASAVNSKAVAKATHEFNFKFHTLWWNASDVLWPTSINYFPIFLKHSNLLKYQDLVL